MADFVPGIIIFVPRATAGIFRLADVSDGLASSVSLPSGVRGAQTRADFDPGRNVFVLVSGADDENNSPPERR
jgi:hypothetical protein